MVFWPSFTDNIETTSIAMPFLIAGIYLNLYVLMPALFRKKRYVLYGLVILATVGLMPYLAILVLHAYYTFQELPYVANLFYSVMGYFIWFSEMAFLLSISTAIKVGKQWLAKERYARKLEKEKFNAEIEFFKQQINPHFVFNALNSIYFAIPKSVDLAQDIVMRLSNMLSHQLYDINKEWIPLSKEAEYLKNYIEIEKIRQGQALDLACHIPEFVPSVQISPILLLPFVENAFKYAPTFNPSSYWVKIHLDVQDNQLHFQVENPFIQDIKTTRHQKGGIGIINVQKRLNMIYPKKHKLRITQEEQVWKVDLILELTPLEQQLPKSLLTTR